MLKKIAQLTRTACRYSTFFTESSEFIQEDGKVGITDYAQDALGEIIHIEFLVDVGDTIAAGDTFTEVESVKAVSGCYSPASGVVEAINEDLMDDDLVSIVNDDAEGAGWMMKLKDFEFSDLMTEDEYKVFLEDH